MSEAEALIELICNLERAAHEHARAFVVVCSERSSGQVVHATGPFPQAEHALIESVREDREWRHFCDAGEEDSFSYQVVPLWEQGK